MGPPGEKRPPGPLLTVALVASWLAQAPLCSARAASDVRRFLIAGQPDQGSPMSGSLVAVAACATLTVVVAIALIAASTMHRLKRRKTRAESEGIPGRAAAAAKAEALEAGLSTLLCLSFNDIQIATEGFKADKVLSDKPHGSVHRGEGPSGEQWAVKRAKGVSLIGEHLFRNEVDFLAKVLHDNILPFQAFSDDSGEQILVFQYMPNGSLSSWLRPPADQGARAPLSFSSRVDIALGVADALCFLHSFSKPSIIHRDVVSDSVLLDAQMRPRLGSLGLLKHLPGEGLWVRMAQKKGYLDPEYFQTFKVTAKCDVYSFGVVLLEMLSALPPVLPSRPDAQRPMTLPQWALQTIAAGKVEDLIDPRMPRTTGGFSTAAVNKFAQIAADCVAPLRKNRPEMLHVASALRALKAPLETAKPGFLARLIPGSTKVAPVQ